MCKKNGDTRGGVTSLVKSLGEPGLDSGPNREKWLRRNMVKMALNCQGVTFGCVCTKRQDWGQFRFLNSNLILIWVSIEKSNSNSNCNYAPYWKIEFYY